MTTPSVSVGDPTQQAIAQLWPGAEWSAQALDGGMTNLNFKVTVQPTDGPSRTVAVHEQMPSEAAHRLGISRTNQMEALTAVTPLGLAPTVVGHLPELGVLVVEFVPAPTVAELDSVVGVGAPVGRALAVLHRATAGATMQGRIADPFTGSRWLLHRAGEIAPDIAGEFSWTHQILDRIRLARGPYRSALLHADVSPGNVLLPPSGAMLIDWEYAGAGDPYYDVGDFAEKARLDRSEQWELVRGYQPDRIEQTMDLVSVYRFVSMLREGLWSVIAGDIGYLDFDHEGYARECLDRMGAIAEQLDFTDALRSLEQRCT